MSLYKPYEGTSTHPLPAGITEFEILKASHKFLREDEEKAETWNDKLAAKYYANLYKEFAICDLKHYKSGNFALRWRTEDEVISGVGETTCGNSRCPLHLPLPESSKRNAPLSTLELPFVYVEHGETKSALVKVVLCGRCVKKLMWKRRKEKEKADSSGTGIGAPVISTPEEQERSGGLKQETRKEKVMSHRHRSSRSRSPRRHSPSQRGARSRSRDYKKE